VDIQLGDLKELLVDKKIALELTTEARKWLADKGYDPAYGARTLKRLLQNSIQDELAIRILEGEFREEDTVCIDAGEEGLVFTKRRGRTAATETEPVL